MEAVDGELVCAVLHVVKEAQLPLSVANYWMNVANLLTSGLECSWYATHAALTRSFQPLTLMHWTAAVCMQWFVILVCGIGHLCTSRLTG